MSMTTKTRPSTHPPLPRHRDLNPREPNKQIMMMNNKHGKKSKISNTNDSSIYISTPISRIVSTSSLYVISIVGCCLSVVNQTSISFYIHTYTRTVYQSIHQSSKTMVLFLFPFTTIRSSRCHRRALDNTNRSRSRPLRTISATESLCDTRVTP